jgi:hypothetical protein
MIGVKITDKYKHVYKYPDYQIIVGRNQKGNDHILDHYFFVKDRCYWFHLANSTSQHIILYLEKDIDKRDLVNVFKDIKMEITSKKKDDVIFCRLEDVVKTKTPGLVTCNNKFLMSDGLWINKV